MHFVHSGPNGKGRPKCSSSSFRHGRQPHCLPRGGPRICFYLQLASSSLSYRICTAARVAQTTRRSRSTAPPLLWRSARARPRRGSRHRAAFGRPQPRRFRMMMRSGRARRRCGVAATKRLGKPRPSQETTNSTHTPCVPSAAKRPPSCSPSNVLPSARVDDGTCQQHNMLGTSAPAVRGVYTYVTPMTTTHKIGWTRVIVQFRSAKVSSRWRASRRHGKRPTRGGIEMPTAMMVVLWSDADGTSRPMGNSSTRRSWPQRWQAGNRVAMFFLCRRRRRCRRKGTPPPNVVSHNAPSSSCENDRWLLVGDETAVTQDGSRTIIGCDDLTLRLFPYPSFRECAD
jgi:hypothetical protein